MENKASNGSSINQDIELENKSTQQIISPELIPQEIELENKTTQLVIPPECIT